MTLKKSTFHLFLKKHALRAVAPLLAVDNVQLIHAFCCNFLSRGEGEAKGEKANYPSFSIKIHLSKIATNMEMGRLVLPHALLPVVIGLRCAQQPMEGSNSDSTSGGRGDATEELPRNWYISGVSLVSQTFFHVKQRTREGLFGPRVNQYTPLVSLRSATIVFNCLHTK